jgi:hypothetical protein
MNFQSNRIYITKAKPKPRKVPRTYARVRALSNTMSKAVTIDLVKGITTFRKRVSPDDLMKAWATRSYGHLMATIPWDKLPDDLGPATSKIAESLNMAGSRTINLLPSPTQDTLRWDFNNPNIRNYLNEVTGRLIVNIRSDTMGTVQRAVQRSFTHGASVRDVSKQIKDTIGLHPIYENAVINYELKMRASGLPSDTIEQRVDAYSDRLLEARAKTVAKTEVRQATNYGQLSVWQQAQQQGLIDKGSKKVWVTCKECITKTPSPCDLCAPMDGEEVDIGDYWTLDDGTVCETPSDAHPNCNCGMTIAAAEPGGEETEEEED